MYSLFLHVRSPGHGLHSTFDDGLFILFPIFRTKAILGTDDIYLDASPIPSATTKGNAYRQTSTSTDNIVDTTSSFCRNIKQFQTEAAEESKNLDNILKALRRYYKAVKTKCQLSLEVPAGFRQSSTLKDLLLFRMMKYLTYLMIHYWINLMILLT
jgi:hypothetical protein